MVGLGDVYLGAPVAVPIDPRHRLVTTKYNPARTWTPQNAVGIGGIYLCVYGMEGPGGYQLVGRTVPVWRLRRDERPWLLRQFDRIRFTPVSVEELAHERAEIAAGRADLEVAPATFSIADVRRIEQEAPVDIATLRATAPSGVRCRTGEVGRMSNAEWITRVDPVEPQPGPLRGLTMALKDNIDLAGVPDHGRRSADD